MSRFYTTFKQVQSGTEVKTVIVSNVKNYFRLL
jgi:hypothetical protein